VALCFAVAFGVAAAIAHHLAGEDDERVVGGVEIDVPVVGCVQSGGQLTGECLCLSFVGFELKQRLDPRLRVGRGPRPPRA
jgi:hypothetical protein